MNALQKKIGVGHKTYYKVWTVSVTINLELVRSRRHKQQHSQRKVILSVRENIFYVLYSEMADI